MSPSGLVARALAAALLAAAPAAAARVRVEAGQEVRLSGQVSQALSVPKVQLQVPALGLSLASPALPPALLAPHAAPQVVPAALPTSVPGLAVASPQTPAASQVAGAAAAGSRESEAAPQAQESLSQSGRVFFDQAAPARVAPAAEEQGFSVGRWLGGLFKRGDQVPAWPGRSGDKVRADGRTFILGPRLGEGRGSVRYQAEYGRYGAEVDLIEPGARDLASRTAEAEALESLGRSDIPHARLLARGADGLLTVKAVVPGDTGAALLARGALQSHAQDNLAELAARLLTAGRTADLSASNLVWNHWESAWTLKEARGWRVARPAETLSQLLDGGFFAAGGASPAAFLAAVRGRLGPGSAAWAGVFSDAAQAPGLAAAFAALAAADRAAPPAPRLEFAPGRASARLDDSWLSAPEARKRLGFDPEAVKDRFDLHSDDPGKLNTEVRELRLADGSRLVSKRSSAAVIRNELFLRRVTRRWFGRYFDTPRSVAYGLGGGEALMVMERSPGVRSYLDTGLDLPQRVALALLVHTFGVGDVNEGNVLYEDGGRASLIDFEQALSAHRPVVSRIPDEGIAAEMPWLSRRSLNRAEDYFPAAAQWRAVLAEPGTQAELRAMLLASGFTPADVPGVLALASANAERLEWILQADVEFVNQFARRAARP